MTVPITRIDETVYPSVGPANAAARTAEREPIAAERFNHTFCIVLVALLVAFTVYVLGVLL